LSRNVYVRDFACVLDYYKDPNIVTPTIGWEEKEAGPGGVNEGFGRSHDSFPIVEANFNPTPMTCG